MFNRRTFVLFFICSFVSLAGILVLPVAFADTSQSSSDIEHVSDGSLDEPGDEAIDSDSDDGSSVTENQGESLAVHGGDESDNPLHILLSDSRLDIPRYPEPLSHFRYRGYVW